MLERAIQAIDKDQPLSDVRTMEQWIGASLARERFASMLLLLFAALALTLAAIGIYGVMSYVVGQRTTEMGIRAALGATAPDIRRLILRDGARLLLVGLAIGLPLALAGSRALGSLLYETPGADPATFAVVLAVLAAAALLASYLPARRAARVAPAEALRRGLRVSPSGAAGGGPRNARPRSVGDLRAPASPGGGTWRRSRPQDDSSR